MLTQRIFNPIRGLFRFLWQPLHGSSAEAGRRREFVEMASLAFAVCTALFVIKMVVAYRDLGNPNLMPCVCHDDWVVSVAQVWACAAQDFAVGLGCLLAAGLALRAFG